MADNLPKRRRRFRFSLRTLFVLLTATCIVLGWMGWTLQIVRQRQSARKWLEDKGVNSGEYRSTLQDIHLPGTRILYMRQPGYEPCSEIGPL